MQRHDNPFHDLWLTEILTPDEFVRMFSPLVARNAHELFSTGNVIVRGTQGSGKSMLLNLLRTRTRIAYERTSTDYPGANTNRPFLSAGIHLIHSGARLVSSRLSEVPVEHRAAWAATTFGDYVNFCLIEDLLDNIVFLAESQRATGALESRIPINWTKQTKEEFIERVVASAAWFGYLKGCSSIDNLITAVSAKLQEYRSYFNFNSTVLETRVEQTKTTIGAPIIAVVEALRESGVVPKNTLLFLVIDQHEELFALEKKTGIGSIFRQVINSALAMRDPRISYRIGTRHYSWEEDVGIWGSGAKLENMRDYGVVDLDEMFRRKENARTARAFDTFAEDVFRRRLNSTDFSTSAAASDDPLLTVFGSSPSPKERAMRYGSSEKPLLSIPEDWDPQWKHELTELWRNGERLQAKLGEIWLRQAAQQRAGIHKHRSLATGHPWRQQIYWIKERNEAALVQLAGSAIQSLAWSGRRHILDLAGFNILAFMSICRAIWAAWLRYVSDEELSHLDGPPRIAESEQIIGISEASKLWFEKLREGLDGDRRTIFAVALGKWFSRGIREDRALSNPGHNGFSVLTTELKPELELVSLIRSARDQGDLIEGEHTTKSADMAPRRKWYLHPLLCPYFRIPIVRTKEPIYTSIDELTHIFRVAQSGDQPVIRRKRKVASDQQPSLFGES